MAVTRKRTRKAPEPADNRHLRYEMEYTDIHSLVPYAFNPRDNAAAVESLANSIKLAGFPVPVIIDRNNVVVAGHTRIEAAKSLGLSEVPTIRAEELTDEQIDAFRIIDNKVASLSGWNFDLLAGELQKLATSGISMTDYGYTREELDCLGQMVADDCLSTEGLVDLEAQQRLQRTERRAPATARAVIGEIVFFVPATVYRTWVDGIRTLHDYNEADIISDVKRRLGMTDA